MGEKKKTDKNPREEKSLGRGLYVGLKVQENESGGRGILKQKPREGNFGQTMADVVISVETMELKESC